MNPRKIAYILSSIVIATQAQAGPAQGTSATAAGTSTASQDAQDEALLKAIRNAKVVKFDYPLRVHKSGTEVYVTTLVTPKATERDKKIEAVLVAKAVVEADKSVIRVHYRLKNHMNDPECDAITVKQSDVKAFGAKAIDVNNLFAELRVVKRKASNRPGQAQ